MNAAQGPDLLGVCEVKNAFVLQPLTARLYSYINNHSYGVAHVDLARDFRGIDTAFVFDSSKYGIDANPVPSHFVVRRTGTRDITQITLTTHGETNWLPFVTTPRLVVAEPMRVAGTV